MLLVNQSLPSASHSSIRRPPPVRCMVCGIRGLWGNHGPVPDLQRLSNRFLTFVFIFLVSFLVHAKSTHMCVCIGAGLCGGKCRVGETERLFPKVERLLKKTAWVTNWKFGLKSQIDAPLRWNCDQLMKQRSFVLVEWVGCRYRLAFGCVTTDTVPTRWPGHGWPNFGINWTSFQRFFFVCARYSKTKASAFVQCVNYSNNRFGWTAVGWTLPVLPGSWFEAVTPGRLYVHS